MVIEWLYSVWAGLSTWFLGLIPPFPAVESAIGLTGVLGPLTAGLTGLGGWIPWDVVFLLVPISVGLYVTGLVLRAVKSLIPSISG